MIRWIYFGFLFIFIFLLSLLLFHVYSYDSMNLFQVNMVHLFH
jgi:hypothetical protein